MASPASVDAETLFRRVSLPLVSIAPRGKDVTTIVRGSATMFGDRPDEPFALGVFLYIDGALVWQHTIEGLDYAHPAEVRVPAAERPAEPGLLFIYATRQAYLHGAETPRKPEFEESWVFLVSDGSGALAVSFPAVPYIGSRKKGIDHKYQCYAGLRLVPQRWRSVAYVINPYPDPLDLRCWLQSTRGRLERVVERTLPPKSVRAIDLLETAAVAGDPARFDSGTLIAWGSLKPQGYVAIAGPAGRARAMDHFNPFWS